MANTGNFLGGAAGGFNDAMKNVIAGEAVDRQTRADSLAAETAKNKATADKQKEARGRYDNLIAHLRSEAKINPKGLINLVASEDFRGSLELYAQDMGMTPEQLLIDLQGQLSLTVNPDIRAAFERKQAAAESAGTAEGTLAGQTTPDSLVAGAKLNALDAVGAGQTAQATRAGTIAADVGAVESGDQATLDAAAVAKAGDTAGAQTTATLGAKRAAFDAGITVGDQEANVADVEKALGRTLTDQDKDKLVGLDNVAKTELGKLLEDQALYEEGSAEYEALGQMVANKIATPGDKKASEYLAWTNEFNQLMGRPPNDAEAKAYLGAEPTARGELSQLQLGVELAKDMYGEGSDQHKAAQDAMENIGKADRNQVAGMRKEFTKASGEFVKLSNAWQKIKKAGMNRDGMSDMALVFMFMKVLDPPSTVREGEAAAVRSSGRLGNELRVTLDRIIESKGMDDTQRAELIKVAGQLYREQLFNQLQLEGQYGALADRAGADRADVVLDYVMAGDRAGIPTANIYDPNITADGVKEVADFVMERMNARQASGLNPDGFPADFMAKLRSTIDKFGLNASG